MSDKINITSWGLFALYGVATSLTAYSKADWFHVGTGLVLTVFALARLWLVARDMER